jgi:hypothetical protein
VRNCSVSYTCGKNSVSLSILFSSISMGKNRKTEASHVSVWEEQYNSLKQFCSFITHRSKWYKMTCNALPKHDYLKMAVVT